jgi:hypothetical protein
MTSIFYILFVLTLHAQDVPPEVVDSAATREQCEDVASKLNASHPIVRSEEAKKVGARFVCFEGKWG